MADEQQQTPAIEPYPAQFPNGYLIPEDLLTRWVHLPPDEPLVVGPLTKADIDQLLFSTADIARAVADLQTGILLASNGNIEPAKVCLQNSTNHLIDGETRNRMLFKAIIESILKVRDAAK